MDTAYGKLGHAVRAGARGDRHGRVGQPARRVGGRRRRASRHWAWTTAGPRWPSRPGAKVWFCSDEHLTFSVGRDRTRPRVGDRVRVVAGPRRPDRRLPRADERGAGRRGGRHLAGRPPQLVAARIHRRPRPPGPRPPSLPVQPQSGQMCTSGVRFRPDCEERKRRASGMGVVPRQYVPRHGTRTADGCTRGTAPRIGDPCRARGVRLHSPNGGASGRERGPRPAARWCLSGRGCTDHVRAAGAGRLPPSRGPGRRLPPGGRRPVGCGTPRAAACRGRRHRATSLSL